ncbi:MAG TPA: hypothetical protein VF321_04470, partial [Gaiellaceae bacterium]
MTKRLVACAAVLAFVLPSVASAARDPRAPLQRHTAADTKRAKAIVLRPSDFAPGWKLDPPAKANPPCTAGPDESSFVQTAKVDPSFTYKDGVTNIGSEADIFRSVAEARRDWRASTPSLLGTCLLQSAGAGLGKKAQVRIASAKTLAAPAGAERSLHYRYVLSVGSTKPTRLVIDVVALGRGRMTVVLYALTVRAPLPPAVVKSLTGVLASRLSAGQGITA